MEGGGSAAAHAPADEFETSASAKSTTSLFGRLRLALSRRTSSASNHSGGGSTNLTPAGSRRGPKAAESEPDVDFLGTSSRSKSAATATAASNPGLSLSQLLTEKRPLDASIPLPETGKGARPHDGGFEFGFSLSRGRRLAMEDFHVAAFETHPSVPGKKTIGTFGVFDGHGGDRAAAFVSRELFRSVLSSEAFASGDAAGALTAGFLATDRAYLLSGGDEGGLDEEAAAASESARKLKVHGKVKGMFGKVRSGSGGVGNGGGGGGNGSGHSGFGLSPPSVSSACRPGEESSSSSPPSTPPEAPPPPPAPAAALSTPPPARQRAPPRDDGCTAAVALVLGDERLLIAHVGDSRAVLVEPVSSVAEEEERKEREGGDRSRRGRKSPPPAAPAPPTAPQQAVPAFTARALSTDHKPQRSDERARIEAAGGAVLWAGTWRVGGVLAVSRAFGDSALKMTSGVVADPDVREETLKRSSSSSFAPLLILATDGVWDALSADEAASIVLARQGEGLEAAAKALTHEAWERGSADNATAVIVRLGAKGSVEERAVAVSAAAP